MQGCMKATQLWWETSSKFLAKEIKFTFNPYNTCMANKDINGSQCTIIWYVGKLKISHNSEVVVENIFAQ